jgi:hypothetical protein
MRWVGNNYPTNSSETSLAICFTTTWPPGVLIMYDGLVTISDNFALLSHVELMKSWDAPESNWMMTGCPNSKKVHVSTSPSGISSNVVWLTQSLLGVGALICSLC